MVEGPKIPNLIDQTFYIVEKWKIEATPLEFTSVEQILLHILWNKKFVFESKDQKKYPTLEST